MLTTMSDEREQLFHEYYAEWMEVYKKDAVRPITYQKYTMTLKRLIELAPTMKICELNKRSYQSLINEYAKTHERTTTKDFHRYLRTAILDLIDEGLLKSDPTRKVVLKGMAPSKKKNKYLNKFELQKLIKNLVLEDKPSFDWLILLMVKTGLRFAEAIGVTPKDFNFSNQTVSITKTWNHKSREGGFAETKNLSSKRTVKLDSRLSSQFSILLKDVDEDKPIFVRGRIFNSTVNTHLKNLCIKAGIPAISTHGLRHTHASLLIFAGVSISSIAKRLGHANTSTTQEVYLHIIKELEDKDTEKIIQSTLDIDEE